MTAAAPNAGNVPPKPDYAQAREFQKLIDPSAKTFTFQTFTDSKSQPKPDPLARITSDKSRVLDLYQRGAGVWVTVNETDGKGRKSENVTRIRAVWQEDDEGFEGEFPLEPSLVVETSEGHYHRYWLLADDWPADDAGKSDFAGVMRRMVQDFGSDNSAKDLVRVLRVPGFLHRKDPGNPQTVRIVGGNRKRYARADILLAFPPIEKERQANGQANGHTHHSGDEDPERIRDALRHIPAHDRDVWVRIGMGLMDELGEAGYGLWLQWSQSCPEKFDAKDCRHKWESFRGKGITIATVFGMARERGWREEKRHQDAPKWNDSYWQTGDSAPQPSGGAEDRSDVVAWPVLSAPALHGPAGEIAQLATEATEADVVAVLATTLVLAGAHFGRSRWLPVGDDRHHARLFAALVGDTARARKGTSAGPVQRVFAAAESHLRGHSTLPYPSGLSLKVSHGPLSTGEGLADAIRDKRDDDDEGGTDDKRLFCLEAELGAALRAMQRQGNTLGTALRSAWDGTTIAPLTKTSKIRATNPHICILCHITREELRQLLTTADLWGGTANRFLWLAVRRSKRLPEPRAMADEDVERLGQELEEAIVAAHGRAAPCLPSPNAAAHWRTIYDELTEDHQGVLGAATSRAESQTLRLALTYALLDRSDAIELHHLQAAHALWRYAFDSAKLIFGRAELDPVAQTIIEALKTGPKTQTEISGLFSRNKTAAEINAALASLQGRGRITLQTEQTPGRPRQTWVLVN
jgi:primase-like protein/DNA primase RepB-like protein